MTQTDIHDLAVVGGGINGAGIARDAAGRGYSVILLEKGDLAGATSSASSKLIHGGLRYLEHYEFRLVAEALTERETLLSIAPHIVKPITFVLPRVPGMRPRWMLRAGLWLYDHLARRSVLPGARPIDFKTSDYGNALAPAIQDGFAYSDCWTDDARLVVANCMSALDHGADVRTRTKLTSARAEDAHWLLTVESEERVTQQIRARAVVNAAGPWVRTLLVDAFERSPDHEIRLVKGSHIVTPRLYEGSHAYILQNTDGRVVLVMPFRDRYSLIGTTDVPESVNPEKAVISAAEIDYLCAAANRYFERKISGADIVWSFSGVRPLYDDGSKNPSEVTRDYKLIVDTASGPPLLSIYGGKITTYRRLAEHVLEKLQPWFPDKGPPWTSGASLPGGDFPEGTAAYRKLLATRYPWMAEDLLDALFARHGTNVPKVVGTAANHADLGDAFGAELYAREVDYLMTHEWAATPDDVLWRRTKAGLDLDDNAQGALATYMAKRAARPAAP